jgi:hypothetical protein
MESLHIGFIKKMAIMTDKNTHPDPGGADYGGTTDN